MQDAALLDQCDGIGRTGIMYAVHHHRLGALRLLLQNGADQNIAAHGERHRERWFCFTVVLAAKVFVLR